MCLLWAWPAPAQEKGAAGNAKPRNYKITDERKDKDGNTVRIIEYDEGKTHIRETMVIKNIFNIKPAVNPDTLDKDSVLVVVNKSNYDVEVYYKRKMIRAYKAVFGPKPQEDKRMEGDRCTPEGWFTIQNKNPNSKYDKFMGLNYPNDSSYARFNRLKSKGTIPQNARIGGDVGIHGIWKGGDDMIEKGICWTDGCIAIMNKDIEELYTFVGVGTRVYVRK
jgi:murein L,D-transpeptidase YafK